MPIFSNDVSSITEILESLSTLILALATVLSAVNYTARRANASYVKQLAEVVWKISRAVAQEMSSAVRMPQRYPRWRLVADISDAVISYATAMFLILLAAGIILLAALKGAGPMMVPTKVWAWLGAATWLTFAFVAQAERARLHAHLVLGELRVAKNRSRRSRKIRQ